MKLAEDGRGARLLLPVAIIAIAALVFLYAWVAHQGGDLSHLVLAGDTFVDAAAAPECLAVASASGGYDGQFFYRIAIAPFSVQPSHAGIRFDFAVYRMQRIVYPLVAYLVSAGDACRALRALPLVNVAALMLLVACAAWVLQQSGVPPVLAFVVGLWPGFLFSIARDLAEPLAAALLVAGLLAAARRRPAWAALCLTLAALTRETTLVAAGIIFLHAALNSLKARRFDPFLLVGALPLLAHLAWKRALFAMWDLPVHWGLGSAAGAPLAAFMRLLRDSLGSASHSGRVQAIELLLFAVFAVLVLVALVRSTADVTLKLCCAGYFLFVAVLSSGIWVEDWAFLRATTEFGVLGTIVLLTSTPQLRRIGAVFMIVAAVALGYDMLWFR